MSIDKLDLQSPDIVNDNFEKLASLFPNCVTESTEGKAIDFDLLKQELSHAVIECNRERYRLEWPGKREAIVTANIPTTNTLRPIREDSVDFDNTENIYIEGDNLEVLKILQESYLGKIKMIYIDPPYNTGKDFVYKDNFKVDAETELFESGQIDEYNQRLVVNPETSGRYHSDWLSMMYPRLKLARNLLSNEGVIFISIDNNEVHNLRKMCDEIFGEYNFIECITWNKRIPKNDKGFGSIHEYILVYAKNTSEFSHEFLMEKEGLEEIYVLINKLKEQKFPIPEIEKEIKRFYKKNDYDRGITLYNSLNEEYRLFGKINMSWPNATTFGPRYEVLHPITLKPVRIPDRGWRWKEETFNKEANKINGEYKSIVKLHDGTYLCGKVWFSKDENLQPSSITFLDEVETFLLRSIISTKSDGGIEIENLFNSKNIFSYPKSVSLIKTLIRSICNNDSIILDFFSGSATTSHAVMQLNSEDGGNRKFIMVQLPEVIENTDVKNICEIGKERIRRAANKIKEEKRAKTEKEGLFVNYEDTQDYGFRVYRLDSSNMQDVYYRPQDFQQETLDLFADNIKPDRNADDLLAQVMLDWGLPLSYKIKQSTIKGKQVFKVAEDSLYACFDDEIDESFAREVAKEAPLRIVFRDNGFIDDTAKINVQQLLKQLSPKTEMKVI